MRSRVIVLMSLFLLGGVISCGPAAVSQSDLDTPEYHYRLGVRSLDSEDYTTAQQAFQRAVDLDKKFAIGWSGLGLTRAILGNFVEGEKNVDKGISLDSKNPETFVYRTRFWIYNQKNKRWYDRAIKDIESALKLSPNHESATFYKGEVYFFGMNFSAAEGQYSKVVDMRGALADKADKKWATTQKIVRARPGTEAGKKIAIKPVISRADLAVLFAEELKLADLFSRMAPQTQVGFQSPAQMAQSTQSEGLPADVVGSWAAPWIKEVMELGVLEPGPDGQFYPDELVSRLIYAVAVQRILVTATRDMSLETKYFGTQSRFPDVPNTHFAFNAIALCTERGIMKADMMTGRFEPTKNIGGADALLIIREIQNSLRVNF